MPEQIDVLHILQPDQGPARQQAFDLILRLPTSHFKATVAAMLDDYSKRRLTSRRGSWVQMALPTDLNVRAQMAASRQIQRLMEARTPDVIHAHGYQAALTTLAARHRMKSEHPPVIFTPFASSLSRGLNGISRTLAMAAMRWVVRQSDVVIVNSKMEGEKIRELAPDAPAKINVIPEGVEIQTMREDFEAGMKRRLLGVDPAAAVIAFMAPPDASGMKQFLEIARQISDERANVEFLVLGDSAKHVHFQQMAHNLGIGGCTVFLGDRADLPEVIASVNIMLIPLDYPGARHAALHALINRIPLIVGADGGLPDIVEGINQSRVVAAGEDSQELQTAIASFLDTVPGLADADLFDDELGFSEAELLVSTAFIDLDRDGLEPTMRPTMNDNQAAILNMIDRFSTKRVTKEYMRLYFELSPQNITVL